jgi:hypothetical protein
MGQGAASNDAAGSAVGTGDGVGDGVGSTVAVGCGGASVGAGLAVGVACPPQAVAPNKMMTSRDKILVSKILLLLKLGFRTLVPVYQVDIHFSTKNGQRAPGRLQWRAGGVEWSRGEAGCAFIGLYGR